MINNTIIKWTNIVTVKMTNILIVIPQGAVYKVLADGPSVHWRRRRRVQGSWPGEQVEHVVDVDVDAGGDSWPGEQVEHAFMT